MSQQTFDEGTFRKLAEAFFHRVERTVAEAVKKAIAESLQASSHTVVAGSAVPAQTGVPSDTGLDLDPAERKKAGAALARRGPNLGVPEGQGMIDLKTLALLLDLAPRTVYRFVDTGAVPKPVTIGRAAKRWWLDEILTWVEHGCPPDTDWRRIRTTALGGPRPATSSRRS